VKLSAHSAGLPGNDLLFNIVPLDPALKGRAYGALAGHEFHLKEKTASVN
jgi:hypothetical protein